MSAGRPWVIYALADPQSGSVRYVGFTSQQPPERRYQAHLKETITKRTHAGCWIKSLLNVGLVPSFHILERGAGPGWEDAEKRWITRFGGSGSRHLTNHRAGGQGNLLEGEAGEVVRERLRQAGKEHMSDPANRERLCEFNMKRMADPAARRRLSELNKEQIGRAHV